MTALREELATARTWLRANLGLDVDEDDQILIVTATALEALRRAEARFDDVAASAALKAQEPLKDGMARQIELLRAIAADFKAAGEETRRLNDHRTAIVGVARDLGHDMKALHGDLVEMRAAFKTTPTQAPSPALLAVSALALFVTGCAAGLMIAQRLL